MTKRPFKCVYAVASRKLSESLTAFLWCKQNGMRREKEALTWNSFRIHLYLSVEKCMYEFFPLDPCLF